MRTMLKTHPIFCGLKEDDIRQVEASLVRRNYSGGQTLFHMGDEGGNMYIIHRGRVKVTIPSSRGEEVILTILGPGEIIGELSFIDGKPRSATVQTIEDTEVYTLRRKDFLNLMRDRFEVVQHVLEILAQRLRSTDAQLAECHFLDVTSRLAKKIWDMGRHFGVEETDGIRIVVRVTQKDLAAMVGATRESINRQLKRLRDRGLIEMSEGHLKILDPVLLARISRIEMPSEAYGRL